MRTVFVAALVACALASPLTDMVEEINSKQKGWIATADSDIAREALPVFRKRLGVDPKAAVKLPLRTLSAQQIKDAPATFDSREEWSWCATLNDIRDQGHCGSCWAFSSSEMISDRECIANKVNVRISAEDINSCATMLGFLSCGSCNGGNLGCAMQYWKDTGVTSDVCTPYTVPKCGPDTDTPCPADVYPTPACTKVCNDTSLDYKSDKHKAKNVYHVSGADAMMAEISSNGPCVTGFTVYSDFQAYKSGIYTHVTGQNLGGHAVKPIGYGEENGIKYWIVANSWGYGWGEGGFFRIRRGENECGFEDACYAGIAMAH